VFTNGANLFKVCFWGAALQRCPQQLQLLRKLAGNSALNPAAGPAQQLSAGGSQQLFAGMQPEGIGATFAVNSAAAFGPVWLLSYGPYLEGKKKVIDAKCLL
jgi:hypothetical protein